MSLVFRGQSARGKAASADDVARLLGRHVGEEVSVTAGKAGIYLYAATEDGAAASERVARDVLALQRMTADIRMERWDPSRQAWLTPSDAVAAGPPPGPERSPGRRRLGAAGAVIAAILEGLGAGGF